ncbi:MAG: FAD-binding oxidoreductase [Candidatus Nanopelagicales bacterium]
MSYTHLAELASLVGEENVLTNELAQSHLTDWTGRYAGAALAVVKPGNTKEVSEIVKYCSENLIPIVPQGGNTGLVHGSVPGETKNGSLPIVLSTLRLKELNPVNKLDRSVIVGAGVTIKDLASYVTSYGFAYGVDLAARDSATIGGTVATDAGGIRVVYFGTTKAQVLGVEAVLADGTVIDSLGSTTKDGAGYDLPAWLVGSEGTLAIITRVRVRVKSPMPEAHTYLVGFNEFSQCSDLIAKCFLEKKRVLAAEAIDAESMKLVCKFLNLSNPLAEHPVVMLLETDSPLELADLPHIQSQNEKERREFWARREQLGEAVGSLGLIHKADVGIPPENLDEFIKQFHQVVRDLPEVTQTLVYGHIAESNLHLEIIGPGKDDLSAEKITYQLVADFGGTVASEHGVGRAKCEFLHLVRSQNYLQTIKLLKKTLDPKNIFNPGAVIALD